MAKKPKFLKNLLTATSALTLVAVSGSAFAADKHFVIHGGNAATNNNARWYSVGAVTAGSGLVGGETPDAQIGNGNDVFIYFAQNADLDIIGAGPYKSIEFINYGGTINIGLGANSVITSITNTLGAGAGGTNAATAKGANIPDGVAADNARILKFAGANDATVGIMTGIGAVDFANQDQTLNITGAQTVTATFTGKGAGGGAGDAGTIYAKEAIIFSGAFDNVNKVKNFKVLDDKKVTFNTHLNLAEDLAIGSAGNGGTVEIEDTKNINVREIKGSAPGKGKLVFKGASTVEGKIGNANALESIEIKGKVEFKTLAGAGGNVIKATSIKLTGDANTAEMKISTRAAEVTGDIIANAAGDGKILLNNVNLDVKGGIGHDKAIGVLEFDADNTLKLLPGTANAGTYKINKVNTAANAAGSGTIIFGSNAAQSFTGEIGADNALKEVVIHSSDGAGAAATTFDLTKGSKITAKNIRLAGAGVDNKLYLQDDTKITGAVSSGATAAVPVAAAANRGQIFVKGNSTISGNIGRDSADNAAAIEKIVFDTPGKTLTVTGAKIETNAKNLLEFTAVDATLKLTNDTNMGLQSANAANALVVTNGTLGTISSAIKTGNTLTLTGAIGDNKNKLKLLEAKAGGTVKLTGGNAYIQTIDLGDGDGTLELNANAATYNFALSHTDEKSILKVTNDVTLDEAVFNNTLKQVDVGVGKTLTLNKVASLKVKDKFIGSGSLKVTGGGTTTITGNIGSLEAAAVNKYNNLTVEGDNTILALDGNGYFSGNVTLNDKTTLKLGGANGTEFKMTTAGNGINGSGPNKGTLVFNNDKDFTFTGNTTNLASIQISGKNVTIVGTPVTQKIEFTDKTKAATLTLDGDIGGAVVTTTSTADNRIHNLAVKGNQEFKSTGAIGSKDNVFGNIRQLTQDVEGKDPVVIKISTKNFFAGIEVAKDNHNAIIFNVDGAIAYSVGANDKRAKSIQFVENGTVKGDAYAKVINVDVEKTATFEKIVSSTDGIVLGSTKGVDAVPAAGGVAAVPAVPAKGATVVFEDGSTVLSKVKTTLDEVGIATFKGSATVKAQLGESANWLNKVAFEDAEIKGKYEIEGADIYASTIEFNKTPVHFKSNNITLTGAVQADGSTFHVGTNNVKFRGGVTSEFEGNITWNIEYKDGNIGSIEAIDDKTVIDFTKADNVIFVIKADANAKVSGDQTATIFKNTDKGVIKANLTDANYELPKSNDFIKWTLVDANKGILALTDNFGAASQEQLNQDKDATPEAKANLAAFTNAKTGSAASYNEEVLRKLSTADRNKSVVKISNNPDRTVLYGVRSITERAVNAPLAARLFTLSSPIAAQSASLETGVAAGTELDQSRARYGLWVTPFYSKTIQKIFDGASGFEGDTFGGTLGFDTMANDTMIVGIAGSFASTKIKHKDTNIGDKTDAKSYYVTVYGVQILPFGDVFLEGMATLGTSTIENKAIRIGANNGAATEEIANGKYDSMSLGGEVAVGTNQRVDMAVLTPVLGLSYNKYMDEGFTETGTKYQNLTVMKKSTNKIDVFVGFRATMGTESGDMIITPDLSAFIRQTLNKGESKINISLDGQAGPLTALTVKPIKTLFQVGAGVTVQSGMIDTSIRYDGAFSSKPNRFEHQGSLKLRLNF